MRGEVNLLLYGSLLKIEYLLIEKCGLWVLLL